MGSYPLGTAVLAPGDLPALVEARGRLRPGNAPDPEPDLRAGRGSADRPMPSLYGRESEMRLLGDFVRQVRGRRRR